ncbi:O-GlcNAcase [Choristoneura fumiferana]|uniref:O-GlcNAcase n=1 Tax=Choristoneura fumiferana TaxID=7141 RepID=UPI003D159596
MTESSPDEASAGRKDFICGVVEGFYGRPWTTEQRKDLFQKLKKWGLDMYVYAPKDDYKHRAYWRELYTVEEAEHLTSLISAARAQGITFCYALSPGLDITYSSQKEITTLKRKLEQVSQFGCTCFALLFDDIEPEMSEADKQIFQSFAHAQVSVTNEIHQHLGCPRFLLCPTQYCSTRAVPTVNSSEYLNTLGTKLSQQIDIMWTGPKVISKVLTTECIEEITAVLRRAPVIWDNLHANDYDQKRIFLGPYCGRSPELIPLLRGVLTNPNCEYNANMIAIRTLAHWASCSLDAPTHMEAVSWDIRLESESEQGVCEDEVPLALGKHVYHPRQALRLAIKEWLPEFSIPKTAQGPVIKPQPPVTVPPVPIIPIMPSVNTCMSLLTATTTTTTTAAAAIPTVSAQQLLADCSHSAISPAENYNSVSNPVMNSLVSPTKVILNESIQNPIIPMAANIALPNEIPVSSLPVPMLGLKVLDENVEKNEDQSMESGQDKNDSVANDSVLETASFIEDMKKEEKDDQDTIIVDDEKNEEQQQNGEMSLGCIGVKRDDRHRNSSEERRAQDNRWEAGPLWRSDEVKLPDNRRSAECRLKTIERSMENEISFAADYEKQVINMLEKGYGEEVTGPLNDQTRPEVTLLRATADEPAAATETASCCHHRCCSRSEEEIISPAENYNSVSNPVMNSLVSPTKVILNESIQNPIIPMAANIALPNEIPVSSLPVPMLGLKVLDENVEKNEDQSMESGQDKNDSVANDSVLETASFIEDMKKEEKDDQDTIIVDDEKNEEQQQNGEMSLGDTPQTLSPSRPSLPEAEPLDVDPPSATTTDTDVVMNDQLSENGSMQVEPSNSPLSTDMMVESVDAAEPADDPVEESSLDSNALTEDDLVLLCDLFYLPFEHGSRGLRMLHDFHWLTGHAAGMLPRGNKPETSEWRRRRSRFAWWAGRARRLLRRLEGCANRELHSELAPYAWELAGVLALLDGLVRWLELGKFPQNIAANTQGSYTWFSKGWREAFESGAQEPWVFRGGLTADLRRLLPVECSGDALRPTVIPSEPPLTVRPYIPSDEEAVCAICHKTCRDGSDCSDLFPSDLQTLPADRLVQPFLTLVPSLCMVIEEDEQYVRVEDGTEEVVNGVKPGIVGYACAALNSKEFYKKQEVAWIPEMCKKYPEQLTEREDLSQAAKECIRHFHQFSASERAPECVTRAHPALLTCCVLAACRDPHAAARLLTCLLAALRAHGASGVHACINATDHYLQQFYSRLGFAEVARSGARVFLARAF